MKREGQERRAALLLDDGSVVEGWGFGATGLSLGEVVFNTGMMGYPESITDPSYNGQILMQTYPLIGNYGVCPKHLESPAPKIEGYVVREVCREPSHWSSEKTLDDWLRENGVPGIERVDTRMLTRKIRVFGVMLGALKVYDYDEPFNPSALEGLAGRIPDPNRTDLVAEVATKEVAQHGKDGAAVALIDCGVKGSIIRSLVARGLRVAQVPPSMDADKILGLDVKGVVISNGPGDPKMVPYVVKTARELIELGIPVLGICLGHQIVALAMGGDTYKLKFGHRGQNHPVVERETGRAYITSQNHGYAVDEKSLVGTGLRVTMVNANDGTVEGLAHERLPALCVQFHPEASPGPLDTGWVFDLFVNKMKTRR